LGQTAATQERLQRLAPHSDFRILFEAQLLHAAGRARESLDLVRTIHSPTVGELRCACLWMELMCWSALGEYDRALWLSKELVDLARQLGETLLEGLGMTRAADSYLRRGEYDESEKWFRDAIQVFSAIRNLKAEGLAWDGLGVVFQRKGDSRGAVELHRKALELHRYSGAGIRTESVTRANLGGALHRLGDLSGARNEIEVAVASFRNMGRRSGLGRVLWNLARVYKDQGERQLALTALAEVCGELRAATEPDVVASAEEAQRRW